MTSAPRTNTLILCLLPWIVFSTSTPFAFSKTPLNTALDQRSPIAYIGAFSASLEREFQASDVLLTRPSDSIPQGHWQAFFLPFAGQASQKAQIDEIGYKTRVSGIVLGLEHSASSIPGLTWGFHGVIGLQEGLTLLTADKASGTLQGSGIGIQGHYSPTANSGFYFDGYGRIGIDEGSLLRTVTLEEDAIQQHSSWGGWTGSAGLFGGYLWPLSSEISIGPLVGLTSILVHHPQITETGSPLLDETIAENSAPCFFSSLGVLATLDLKKNLKLLLETRWDRILSNTLLLQEAYLTQFRAVTFNAKSTLFSHDSFEVSAQINYEVHQNLTVGANVSSQFTIAAKPLLSGNLLLGINF